jgi:Raf kinase inhibitor-like YbhB/YbcL family protein
MPKKLILITLFTLFANAFTLSSADIKENFYKINAYNRYNCGGDNISPELHWANAPKNTKSFALTLYDIDAPNGWWHWIVIDIAKDTKNLESNASLHNMPKGSIELKNSYNTFGYGGPCPPKGDKAHRYIFTLYALDTDKLESNSTDILKAIKIHTIKSTSFKSLYKR